MFKARTYLLLIVSSSVLLQASVVSTKQVLVGGVPNSVAIADLNGDGIPDLVTANGASDTTPEGSVSILLGKGKGSFGQPTMLSISGQALAVVVADFNRDKKPDLVVLSYNGLFFLAGNGNGTFQLPVTISGPFATNSVLSTADFNNDGIPDLAAAVGPNQSLQIFLGKGDGTFLEFESLACGALPYSAPLAVADFNNDGKVDVASVCFGIPEPVIAIFLGNGDGTFQPAANITVNGQASSIASADFNKDGKIDLAVVTFFGGLVIFDGNGDGTFTQASTFPVSGSGAPITADFNGDGYPDIATPNGKEGSVLISLNNGHGAFTTYSAYGVGGSLSLAAAADLNHDGNTDIAAANAGAQTVDLLFGSGHGTFDAPRAFTAVIPVGEPTGDNTGLGLATADFNKDGNLDIATSFGAVLFGNGKDNFKVTEVLPSPAGGGSVLAADLNGDGNPDIVVGGTSLSVALGNGDGAFGAEINTSLNSLLLNGLVAADFNGDGKLDIIGASGGASAIGGAYLFPGNGDGTFKAPITLSTQTLTAVAKADFNGDGKPDIVLLSPGTSTSNGQLILLLGNGNGSFHAPVDLPFGDFHLDALCLGDLNGDGIPDIIVSGGSVPEELPGYAQIPTLGSAYLSVLLGQGDGTFAAPVTYQVHQPSAVSSGIAPGLVAADLNSAGNQDIVLSVFTYLYTFNGNGDGTLVQQPGEIPVSNVNSVITGNVTNQTLPDLLLGADAYQSESFSSSVWILLNQ